MLVGCAVGSKSTEATCRVRPPGTPWVPLGGILVSPRGERQGRLLATRFANSRNHSLALAAVPPASQLVAHYELNARSVDRSIHRRTRTRIHTAFPSDQPEIGRHRSSPEHARPESPTRSTTLNLTLPVLYSNKPTGWTPRAFVTLEMFPLKQSNPNKALWLLPCRHFNNSPGA